MSDDKFKQLSDARARFAELWDVMYDHVADDDKVWAMHWKAHQVAAMRVLALMDYTDTVPRHYNGCLPSSHPDYIEYTLEELP